MTAGFFTDRFSQFTPFAEKRELVGWNTGNMIFRDAIHKMIDCQVLPPHQPFDAAGYDAFITTDLIWLRENVAPWPQLHDQLKSVGDRPLVPISIGLQAPERRSDFRLHPGMVDYMKALQERTRLAVRGAYTAEILKAHGIGHTEIVGCPSIYQLPLYNASLEGLLAPLPERLVATANFRTFSHALDERERDFLDYVLRQFDGFAEQTFEPLAGVGGMSADIIAWMEAKSYCFFDLETWRRYNLRYNFSMGLRFHGNVAALLAGMPALFVVIDSRTSEMTDFLGLPAIAIADFDPDPPLETYYRMADYGDFVASYPDRLDRFAAFVAGCGLSLSGGYRQALAAFSPRAPQAGVAPNSPSA